MIKIERIALVTVPNLPSKPTMKMRNNIESRRERERGRHHPTDWASTASKGRNKYIESNWSSDRSWPQQPQSAAPVIITEWRNTDTWISSWSQRVRLDSRRLREPQLRAGLQLHRLRPLLEPSFPVRSNFRWSFRHPEIRLCWWVTKEPKHFVVAIRPVGRLAPNFVAPDRTPSIAIVGLLLYPSTLQKWAGRLSAVLRARPLRDLDRHPAGMDCPVPIPYCKNNTRKEHVAFQFSDSFSSITKGLVNRDLIHWFLSGRFGIWNAWNVAQCRTENQSTQPNRFRAIELTRTSFSSLFYTHALSLSLSLRRKFFYVVAFPAAPWRHGPSNGYAKCNEILRSGLQIGGSASIPATIGKTQNVIKSASVRTVHGRHLCDSVVRAALIRSITEKRSQSAFYTSCYMTTVIHTADTPDASKEDDGVIV